MLRVGILGCGTIAAKVADSLKGNKKVVIAGVASRERNKAKKFAAAHCPEAKVFTGYEKLIFFEAKNRGVFVAEAMWTSYTPLHKKALELIAQGKIGAVKYVSANLGYDIENVPRLNSQVLGGGSYLDLGVYTTNFALSFMGNDIKVSRVFARQISSGIDKDTSYSNFYVTMCADTDKYGVVIGENGKIKFSNINNYRKIALYSPDDQLIEEYVDPDDYLHGYVHEFEACADAVRKGLIQAPDMPWSRTAKIAQLNDTIRSMM